MSKLSLDQQNLFQALLLPYNLLVYPVCLGFFLYKVQKSVPKAGEEHYSLSENSSYISKRKKLLKLPFYLTVITIIGWLPGAVVFPLFIDMFSGGLSIKIYLAFAVSFVTSWLIALTYSYALLSFVVVRGIYTKMWDGFSRLDGRELKFVEDSSGVLLFMGGLIPLSTAVIIITSGQSLELDEGILGIKGLLVFLIVLGMVGLIFVYRITNYLKSTIQVIREKEQRTA